MSFSTAHNRKKNTRNYDLRSFTLIVICVACIALISLVIGQQQHVPPQKASQDQLYTAQLKKRDEDCRMVRYAEDKCAFIKVNCKDEEAGLISYLSLYYCRLTNFHLVAISILSLWLALLFTTIGIAASDFFCINLNTVASILGLSESIVGTTFLAFGNGSPDFFSTFAAMKSNSGGLAVGELIGAAAFITSVVAGSMAMVREFRVGKKNLVRDVGFFIVAVCLVIGFLADGFLYLWECFVMVGFYLLYVIVVFVWHWYFEIRRKRREMEATTRCQLLTRSNEDVMSQDDNSFDQDNTTGQRLYRDFEDLNILEQGSFPDLITYKDNEDCKDFDDSPMDSSHSIRIAAEMTNNMRITGSMGSRRNTISPIRPSLVGALEFRSTYAVFMEKSRQINESQSQYFDDLAFIDPFIDRGRGSHEITTRSSSFAPLRTRAASSNDITVAKIADFENFRGLSIPNPDMAKSTALYLKNFDLRGYKRSRLQSAPQGFSIRRSILARASTPYNGPQIQTTSAPEENIPAVKILPAIPIRVSDEVPDSTNDSSKISQHLQVQTPTLLSSSHSRQSSTSTFPTHFELQNGSSTRGSIPQSPVLQDTNMMFESSLPEYGMSLQKKPIYWWPYQYFPDLHTIYCTLFPTLCTWEQKSIWDKFVSIVSAPSIFLLAITLPVVESESPEGSQSHQELELLLETSASSRRPSRMGQPENASIEAQSEWLAYRRSIDSRDNCPFLHQIHGPFPHIAPNIGVSHQTSRTISSHENEINFDRNQYLQNSLDYPPLVDWNRWLVSVQIFTAPIFLIIIFWVQSVEKSLRLLTEMILYSLVGSLIAYSILVLTTSPNQVPKNRFILCFLGFVVSIAWIHSIASEVVGILKALGVILDIDDAILGLTVFALGSSLGDLVADITVARLGFPVMALSACFGGPMFNILLGIGLSGIYVIINDANSDHNKNPALNIIYKPYQIQLTSTLIISALTLLATLIGIIISVPLNRWVMTKRIGYGLITLWSVSTMLNLGLEVSGVGRRIF